jgi:hypothetical protein
LLGAKHTARKNTTHKGPAYILATEDTSFLIKKILTPDDGHLAKTYRELLNF